jgi:hypothetical protein
LINTTTSTPLPHRQANPREGGGRRFKCERAQKKEIRRWGVVVFFSSRLFLRARALRDCPLYVCFVYPQRDGAFFWVKQRACLAAAAAATALVFF